VQSFIKKYTRCRCPAYNIKTLSSKLNKARNRLLKDADYGQRLGLADAGHAFSRAEQGLEDATNAFSGLVVYFRTMPTVMTVGGFFPEFGYDGRGMQRNAEAWYNGPLSRYLVQYLGLWRPCRALYDLVQGRHRTGAIRPIVHFATAGPLHHIGYPNRIEHLENTCTNPSWWDSLKSVEKNQLLLRMHIAGSITEERMSNCLSFSGVKHDDWVFDRFEFLNV
jgi:hypothetical protein